MTLWFNGQSPHAAPLIVNMFHSALLRNLTGRSTSRLVLLNHPYYNGSNGLHNRSKAPFLTTSKHGLPEGKEEVILEVLKGIFLPLALCFHAASFVTFPIAERISRFKHLQMITGVAGGVYWTSNFIFDLSVNLSVSMVFIIAIYFNNSYLVGWEYIG